MEIFLDAHYKPTIEKLGFLYFLLARDAKNEVSLAPRSRVLKIDLRVFLDNDSIGGSGRFDAQALPRPAAKLSRYLDCRF